MQLPTFDKLFAIHRCFSSNVPRTTDKFVSLDDICQSITSCKNSSQSHAQVMNFIQTNKQWEKLWTKMKFGPNQRRTFGADIHGFALFFLNLAGVQATTVRNQITQENMNVLIQLASIHTIIDSSNSFSGHYESFQLLATINEENVVPQHMHARPQERPQNDIPLIRRSDIVVEGTACTRKYSPMLRNKDGGIARSNEESAASIWNQENLGYLAQAFDAIPATTDIELQRIRIAQEIIFCRKKTEIELDYIRRLLQ